MSHLAGAGQAEAFGEGVEVRQRPSFTRRSSAAAELAAAGGRRGPPRPVTGVDALTPSEHRVAALAAAGRTNKAIARELYVTPKTVEVHLSSVYRKLGISSRRELEAAGLTDPAA